MFFVVSKVFWALVQPISLIFLLIVIGLALTAMGKRRIGLALGTLGGMLLGIASFTNIGAVLIAPLEARFERPAELPQEVDTIVLLGGATSARISTARQVTETSEAGDRLIETLWLAQRYPEARIILTGGVAQLMPGAETEAATMERLMVAFGIAPERLVLEGDARNTDENAEYTKALLGPAPGAVLLVTSAFHMPRSVGLFRKVGVVTVPWPTDYRSAGTEAFGIDIIEPMANLQTTGVAIKEWIGLAVYHWTGRIAEILPGQVSN
ncbi:MAG: YdcF family protein [Devosia sp.]